MLSVRGRYGGVAAVVAAVQGDLNGAGRWVFGLVIAVTRGWGPRPRAVGAGIPGVHVVHEKLLLIDRRGQTRPAPKPRSGSLACPGSGSAAAGDKYEAPHSACHATDPILLCTTLGDFHLTIRDGVVRAGQAAGRSTAWAGSGAGGAGQGVMGAEGTGRPRTVCRPTGRLPSDGHLAAQAARNVRTVPFLRTASILAACWPSAASCKVVAAVADVAICGARCGSASSAPALAWWIAPSW